jgi:hypothetical protein
MLATSSVLNLYLQPRKSSVINVLLGVIPAPNPTGAAQLQKTKLLITGDASILLNNQLGQGETIGVNYQQLTNASPRFNLVYRHPYIFKSAFGTDLAVDMYKRDSSYLNLEVTLGATYSLGANQSGRVFFHHLKTNTYPDTNLVRFTRRLPENLDVKVYDLGLQYDLNTTDYRRSPRKGSELGLVLSFGTKKILTNTGITSLKDPSFNYAGLYDSVKRSTYQFKVKAAAARYLTLRRNTVLKLAFRGGLLLSQNYFRNELYQLGGFKLLRGFDEESIFANQYAVLTAEYRYLLPGADSYFFVFADGGYSENKIIADPRHTYISGGLGLNFATRAGLFNISFAAGKRDDISFGFKQSKIHFGYVTVF